VSDDFYSPGMIGALYKRQSRSASLKKTVLGAIEHRALMVTVQSESREDDKKGD